MTGRIRKRVLMGRSRLILYSVRLLICFLLRVHAVEMNREWAEKLMNIFTAASEVLCKQ